MSHGTYGIVEESLPSLLMKRKESVISVSRAFTTGVSNGINATDRHDFSSGN